LTRRASHSPRSVPVTDLFITDLFICSIAPSLSSAARTLNRVGEKTCRIERLAVTKTDRRTEPLATMQATNTYIDGFCHEWITLQQKDTGIPALTGRSGTGTCETIHYFDVQDGEIGEIGDRHRSGLGAFRCVSELPFRCQTTGTLMTTVSQNTPNPPGREDRCLSPISTCHRSRPISSSSPRRHRSLCHRSLK
jgi:hypothetical protein